MKTNRTWFIWMGDGDANRRIFKSFGYAVEGVEHICHDVKRGGQKIIHRLDLAEVTEAQAMATLASKRQEYFRVKIFIRDGADGKIYRFVGDLPKNSLPHKGSRAKGSQLKTKSGIAEIQVH